MGPELLGSVEAAVLRAVAEGQSRPYRIAERVGRDARGAERFAVVYRVVERCQREGLLRGERDPCGRVYAVTPAGRRRLRERREFGTSVARLLATSR